MDYYICELCGSSKATQYNDKKYWCRDCRKSFKKIPRLKRLNLNGMNYKKECVDCGKVYSKFRWSPFWCPQCDVKRLKRISKSLDKIAEGFN